MSKKFTDENIDQVLGKLVNKASLDDATVDQIADSPQLWWAVQRKIKTEKRPVSIWNGGILRRWLKYCAPVTVALLLAAFFVSKPTEKPVEQASITQPQLSNETVSTGSDVNSVKIPTVDMTAAKSVEATNRRVDLVTKAVVNKKKLRPQPSRTTTTIAKLNPVEVKSEFIALSYARNPESGQIVRVKVPSSMMVSLGLVTSVEKPTSLINAEILVGDDGMTHAIRFIR